MVCSRETEGSRVNHERECSAKQGLGTLWEIDGNRSPCLVTPLRLAQDFRMCTLGAERRARDAFRR